MVKITSYFSVKKNNLYGNKSLKKFSPINVGVGYKITFLFFKYII